MDSVPMEAVADGVLVVDRAGTVVAASDEAVTYAVVDPPVTGRTIGSAYPSLEAAFAECLNGDEANASTECWVNDGVEDRYVSVRARRADEGDEVRIVLTFLDVTDRRDRNLERYETIVEALPDPVYATDARGRLTYVNPAFRNQLGYDREAIERGELHFDDVIAGDGTDAVLAALRRMMANDDDASSSTLELTGVDSDGRRIPYEDTFALLPHGDRFGGSAGVLHDVSDRRRRREVLTVTNRALRHNLRTHVNTIAGYTDLLQKGVEDGEDPDELASFLDKIEASAEWLSKLGDTLRRLQTAIDEARREDLHHDVGEIVRSVADSHREEHPDATVRTSVRDPDEVLAGSAIRYAVENLVENGIVHNDDDPTVAVWVADAPRDGWIDVIVEDDGPGIPDDERAIVLGDAEVTQLQHGSGIGLWVTRWIVDVFDGEVIIRDNEPTGTVVTLRLPRATTGAGPSGERR